MSTVRLDGVLLFVAFLTWSAVYWMNRAEPNAEIIVTNANIFFVGWILYHKLDERP